MQTRNQDNQLEKENRPEECCGGCTPDQSQSGKTSCCGEGGGCCGANDSVCCKDEDEKNDPESDEKEQKEKTSKQLAEEYLNGWRRCQADFENYKQSRMNMQKDLATFAIERFSLNLLPVIDNFHASTDHIPEDQKGGAWVQGIMYIQQQLESVLAENGVQSMPTVVGDAFDPSQHEAIEMKEDDSQENQSPEGSIQKILQKGYTLGGKVIRPARVVVA